jgi:uncharacterized GH25 family protein
MNRIQNNALALLALSALAFTSGNALAHRTWLLPHATVVEGKDPSVTLDAAVSEELFEFDTNALQLDTLRVTAPDGTQLAPESRQPGRRRTSFEVKLPQEGTYRIAGTVESAMASWKVGNETKRWRGKVEDIAKEVPKNAAELQLTRTFARVETFVAQGEPGKTVPAPAGVGLELLPLTQPVDLNTGDVSKFRLLLDGQPAANVDVTLVRGGHRYRYKMGETALKTDAQGEFSITWAEAGRYWLGASVGARGGMGDAAAATAGQPQRRATYSATLDVLPQ